jgi:hypothetical protein
MIIHDYTSLFLERKIIITTRDETDDVRIKLASTNLASGERGRVLEPVVEGGDGARQLSLCLQIQKHLDSDMAKKECMGVQFGKDGSVFAYIKKKTKTNGKLWERKQKLACDW